MILQLGLAFVIGFVGMGAYSYYTGGISSDVSKEVLKAVKNTLDRMVIGIVVMGMQLYSLSVSAEVFTHSEQQAIIENGPFGTHPYVFFNLLVLLWIAIPLITTVVAMVYYSRKGELDAYMRSETA